MRVTDEEAILNNFFKMYNDEKYILRRKIKPRNIKKINTLNSMEKYEELCYVGGLRKKRKIVSENAEVAEVGETIENINNN